jgi:acylphosphatase
MKHLSIRIKGKVQGVFFRASTKNEADQLGITGYVRNEWDGSVYIEAEGTAERLQQFTSWCEHGPARAKVEEIIVNEGEIKNFSRFEIQR